MKIRNVVNFGCSFAYGNCAESHDRLSSEHRSVATGVAETYGLTEINLARPGNSNEGILDNVISWLSVTPKKERDNCLLMVGWSGASRFGFVSDLPRISNKPRVGKDAGPTAERAFTLGPTNPYRYVIDKFDHRWAEHYINLMETGRLVLYRSLISMQSLAARNKMNIIYYHSLQPMRTKEFPEVQIYEENDNIRNLINVDQFYKFEKASLQELTNSNKVKYFVSPKDSHPNHIAYNDWNGELVKWIEENNRFGYQL